MGFLHLLTFAAFLAVYVEAQFCPQLYKRYSKDHTFCKPKNPTCKITSSTVSEIDKEIILNEHNIYRSKIATGSEENLPPATNMLQMFWDAELADVAQQHALQCAFEHDCSDCRRVRNFGVGQNLFQEEGSGFTSIGPANWPSAIKGWYDEVQYFGENVVDSFVKSLPEEDYGHFSQLIWADTWRIGCGYVAFQTGDNSFEKLYTCNYGPGGNIQLQSVYKSGEPASECPLNAKANADYPGLCKITDGKAPHYEPEGSYLFYCDFQNQADCNFFGENGAKKWMVYKSLSGNYLSIVLKGGEESSITFRRTIHPKQASSCVVTNYRKGPNVDGDEDNSKAVQTYTIIKVNHPFYAELASIDGTSNQQFSQFSMNMGWKMETQMALAFSVPDGSPEQFFEVKSIYAYDGKCK